MLLPSLNILEKQFLEIINYCFQKKSRLLGLAFITFIFTSIVYPPESLKIKFGNTITEQNKGGLLIINEKIKEPFKPIEGISAEDHFAKRNLRFTPFLIGNILGFSAIHLFYLQYLSVILFIYLSFLIIQKVTSDNLISFLGTIALLFCYTGLSFFHDTFFFDSYAFLGLLTALYFNDKPFLILILLVTYFVDERSVIPSFFIPLFYGLQHWKLDSSTNFIESSRRLAIKNAVFWYVFISVASYFLVRIYLEKQFNLTTPVGDNAGVYWFTALKFGNKLPYAIFSPIKFYYILIFIGILQLFVKRYYFVGLWLSVLFITNFLIGTAVEDVTRSLSYGFLIIFIVLQITSQNSKENNRILVKWVSAIAVLNLLTPTYTLIVDIHRIIAFPWIIPQVYCNQILT